MLVTLAAPLASAQSNRKVQVAGIAFYNWENLFDTIPNNPEGRDLEFTPQGPRQWDGRKYWKGGQPRIRHFAVCHKDHTHRPRHYRRIGN